MDDSHLAAVTLAALEIAPGDPSDISEILRDESSRQDLADFSARPGSSDLLTWLSTQLDYARVEHWRQKLARAAQLTGTRVILVHTAAYPAQLARCWDAPPLLFVTGTLANTRSVGIVGSRRACDQELSAAATLAAAAVAAGFSVVSGLAAGVDTAAHRGALSAGGHTAAIMGTGISRIFPSENQALAEEIARSGALISQFAPDAPRTGTTFLRRNCVIAGMVDADIVVAASERSGTRHQAEQAVRYGRPLLLWRPALEPLQWASDLVRSGVARFIDDPSAIGRYLMAGAR